MSILYRGYCKEWNLYTNYRKTKEECENDLGCGLENLTFEEINETDHLLLQVPDEFRSTLSYMAYERGHSAGESEVLGILRELIYDLKPAIDKYTERLNKNS